VSLKVNVNDNDDVIFQAKRIYTLFTQWSSHHSAADKLTFKQ